MEDPSALHPKGLIPFEDASTPTPSPEARRMTLGWVESGPKRTCRGGATSFSWLLHGMGHPRFKTPVLEPEATERPKPLF